jgi:signal transduction histidine kinase
MKSNQTFCENRKKECDQAVLVIKNHCVYMRTKVVLFFLMSVKLVYSQLPAKAGYISELIDKAEKSKNSQPDSALFYINIAIVSTEQLDMKKQLADALMIKAGIIAIQNNFEEAGKLFTKSISLSRDSKNIEQEAKATAGLGLIEKLKANYKAALDYYRISFNLVKQTGNQKAIAQACSNLAAAFGTLAQYDSSMYYQLKAITIFEPLKEYQALGKAYSNMGAIYTNIGNSEEALKYIDLAFINSEKAGDKQQQMHLLSMKGNVLSKLKNYTGAIQSHRQSIELAKELGQEIYIARGYQNLGSTDEEQGKLDQAIANYEKAYSIVRRLGSKIDMLILTTYLGSSLNKKGKANEALQFLTQGIQLTNDGNNQETLMGIYDEMHKSYARLGDYKNAYYYQLLFLHLNDSIKISDKESTLESLRLQYETEKKDQQIRLLSAQEKVRENESILMIGLVAALVILLIVGSFLYRQRMQIARFRQIEYARQQTEKLRYTIASDLHDDIGSTLSSISYYSEAIKKQVTETNPAVVSMLNKMERASGETVGAMSDIVWVTNPAYDKGADLYNRMQSYATEMCSIKNIELDFTSDNLFEDEILDMHVRKNIYLIFKEAVNNAIKYADCRKLVVQITHNEIQITDDGKGFDIHNDYMGNGLKNIRRRASEINAILEVTSNEKEGTTVKLKW